MSVWAFVGALGWGLFFGLAVVFFKEQSNNSARLGSLDKIIGAYQEKCRDLEKKLNEN